MFPGAAVAVSRRGEVLFEDCYGTLGDPGTEPVTSATLFDLASLTKALATTPCWMVLAARHPAILDKSISHWFPGVPDDKAPITPRHLLAHCSGLPAWKPYYLHGSHTPEQMRTRILSEPWYMKSARGASIQTSGSCCLLSLWSWKPARVCPRLPASNVYEPLGLKTICSSYHPATNHVIARTREDDPPGL